MRSGRVLVLLALALPLASCALPRWPVEGRLTSPYGLRLQGWRPDLHTGVDIAVPAGTPVRAMVGGVVRFAGAQRGYGKVVWLDHGEGTLTLYAHLSELRVHTAESVEGGQVVGLAGQTGDASGPHLHFEIRRGGRSVDPVPLLGGFPPPGEAASRPRGREAAAPASPGTEAPALLREPQSAERSLRISSVRRGTTSNRSPTIP